MTDSAKIQGEGDYEAARRYDKAAREFVASGAVDAAAGRAAPRDAEDAAAMEAAEREGRSHSKGEALADEGSTLPTAAAATAAPGGKPSAPTDKSLD